MGQDALGEIGNRPLFLQFGRRAHDHLQTLPLLGDRAQLLIRTQGSAYRRDQPCPVELRLGPVIVDVVLFDHRQFRRVAGFASTQDQAALHHPQFVADVTDQVEAGARRFHDHIEQGDGDIRMLLQDAARRLAARRVQQAQGPTKDVQVLQGKTRHPMHLRIVVDDQHLPG